MACSSFILRLLVVCQIVLLSSAAPKQLWAVYARDTKVFKIAQENPHDYIAVASFDNTVNQTGWAKLDLTTTGGAAGLYTGQQQAYAAGFLEAYITRDLMKMHWTNTIGGFCPTPLSSQCQSMKTFLVNNLNWVLNQIKILADTDPYWYQVQLLMTQIAGLQDGYVRSTGIIHLDIDVFGVYLFQVAGDMEDLANLFPPSNKASSGDSDDKFGLGTGRCSALIRLLKDYSDLYVAQDTWAELNGMLRILKKYTFDFHLLPFNSGSIPGKIMTFSSYPGVLMSGDDFYTISSGLVTQETTIGNSNPNLTHKIIPEAVFEGIRSLVANRLATTGLEWAQIFSYFNSGTYNNQWMIVNYNKFKAGNQDPAPGILYLLEQIPLYIHYEDITTLLYNQSYFGSYNIAYFPMIYNLSGMPAMAKKYGDWFTYDKTPRALIFKREVEHVVDLKSMTKLMRYNNYKVDPLSRCNCTPPYSSENAIACRDDLNPINGTYAFSTLGHRPHIATDMKLTSSGMSKALSFLAISSPTYDDLPPFQWSKSDYNTKLSHVGHPDLWQFPLILFNGSNPMV